MSPPAHLIRFRRLALVVAGSTLFLVAVGGLVRATGSGLGCLDEWPKCQGGWIAPLEYQAIIEYAHRALAAVVVVLVAVQAVASRRWLRGTHQALRRASYGAVAVVLTQSAVGGLVVFHHLHAAIVTLHFLLATLLVALTTGAAAGAGGTGLARAYGDQARLARLGKGGLAGTFLVLLAGVYVREKGAGAVFGDWPLMAGRLIPPLGSVQAQLQFGHRVLALAVGLYLVALAIRVRRDPRRDVRMLAFCAVGLYGVQALVGAANVLTRLTPASVLGHVALAALTWSALVALVVRANRAHAEEPKSELTEGGLDPESDPEVAVAGGVRPEVALAGGPASPPDSDRASSSPTTKPGRSATLQAYVNLTKPRIVLLLLVTTVPAMILAQRGFPPVWLVVATLAGGIMTAGGANAINQYLDRDIDEKMSRTRKRPLPAHLVAPGRALVFGIALGVIGFVWLTVVVNLLAASLAVGAILFYVFVYTIWLKRSTAQNIVIGGAAGAAPVLVGWAAVTGSLALPAWILFVVIFLWTPPHFWALALRYRDDYAAAGVPMLPVVGGTRSTTRQIVVYSVQLVTATLVLYPAARMGPLYLVAASALGAGFMWFAVGLYRDPTTQSAMRLFKYSINYLALLFAAVAVDRLVMLG